MFYPVYDDQYATWPKANSTADRGQDQSALFAASDLFKLAGVSAYAIKDPTGYTAADPSIWERASIANGMNKVDPATISNVAEAILPRSIQEI
jgi:hypothetical protein